MKLYTPVFLNEIGNRFNNEDAVYPELPYLKSNLFLVCDGVGGQEKGEEASKLVCQAFSEYAKENEEIVVISDWIARGLVYVESKIKQHIEKHPAHRGMATTVTLAYFLKENKVIIGWVGDSRIYHIRDGKILFQTKDHSLVQSMIDMGEITKEEAKIHPKKNIITRAVKGYVPTHMDVKVIEDIEEKDFFFLCTDGILENLGEEEISLWFSKKNSPENIKEIILKNALGKTQDNFSMYLIKIEELAVLKNLKTRLSEIKTTTQFKNMYLFFFLLLVSILLYLLLSRE